MTDIVQLLESVQGLNEMSIWVSIGVMIAILISTIVNAELSKRSRQQTEKSIEQTKEAMEREVKVNSARLIRDIHAPWRDDDKFKKLLARIRKHEMDYTPDEIDRFLNKFDGIAMFWDDGTLTEPHVRSLFGANLRWIRNDACIYLHMENARKEHPRTFSYLVKLLEQSKKWDP